MRKIFKALSYAVAAIAIGATAYTFRQELAKGAQKASRTAKNILSK